jgi:hypothetical protein
VRRYAGASGQFQRLATAGVKGHNRSFAFQIMLQLQLPLPPRAHTLQMVWLRVLPVHFASRQINATAGGISKQLSIDQRTR